MPIPWTAMELQLIRVGFPTLFQGASMTTELGRIPRTWKSSGPETRSISGSKVLSGAGGGHQRLRNLGMGPRLTLLPAAPVPPPSHPPHRDAGHRSRRPGSAPQWTRWHRQLAVHPGRSNSPQTPPSNPSHTPPGWVLKNDSVLAANSAALRCNSTTVCSVTTGSNW